MTNVPIGRNRYDAMQLSIRRRFNKGLTFQVNYNASKTLEQLTFLNTQDQDINQPGNSRLHKRLTPFDVPQKLSLVGVYELPFGKGRRFGGGMPWIADFLFGRWTLGWNITKQSGFPIDFPNAAPLQARSAKLPEKERSVFRWFDTSLFPKVAGPAPYTLRDFPTRFPDVRFMDLTSWDFNLSKDFPIKERARAQLRVDAINVGNTPFITEIQSLNVAALNFGQLQFRQRNNPRTLYVDLRLLF